MSDAIDAGRVPQLDHRSLELFGMQFGLERMHALLDRLGNPEREFDAIHVVGTNGKSSTTRFCEALLEAEGVRTGAYISPHITTFRERIRIGGETIDATAYEEAVLAVRDAVGDGVTQFEALTAAALLAFAQAGVEWAVIEAGLGGRLDATNVLPRSRVEVLTNIDLEHIELLGRHPRGDRRREAGRRPGGRHRRVGEPGWEEPRAAGGAHAGGRGRRQLPGSEPGGRPGRGRGGAGPAGLAGADGAHGGPGPARGARPRRRSRSGTARTTRPGCGGWCPSCRRCSATGRPSAVFSALADKDVAAMVSLLRNGVPDDHRHDQSRATGRCPPRSSRGITGGAATADPHEALEAARTLAGPRGAVVVCGSLYLLHDLSD